MNCILCNKEAKELLTDTVRGGIKNNVFYCKDCDLGILEDYRTEEELIEYYNNEYRLLHKPNLEEESSPDSVFNTYKDKQEERINLLLPHINKDSKLLEIGCSTGQFLFNVKKEVGSITGVEYDLDYAINASKICGCEVAQDISFLLDRGEKYNVICAFQVLEHIKNPLIYIQKLKQLLLPNGVICLEVPNLYDPLISIYNINYYKNFYYHKAHLWYFSKKSLLSLMDINKIKGEVYYSQDFNILNHIHWLCNNKPQPNCNVGLNPIKINNDYNKSRLVETFLRNLNSEYIELLKFLEITSNITFIGSIV